VNDAPACLPVENLYQVRMCALPSANAGTRFERNGILLRTMASRKFADQSRSKHEFELRQGIINPRRPSYIPTIGSGLQTNLLGLSACCPAWGEDDAA